MGTGWLRKDTYTLFWRLVPESEKVHRPNASISALSSFSLTSTSKLGISLLNSVEKYAIGDPNSRATSNSLNLYCLAGPHANSSQSIRLKGGSWLWKDH